MQCGPSEAPVFPESDNFSLFTSNSSGLKKHFNFKGLLFIVGLLMNCSMAPLADFKCP
jgi:hypothetical protein